MGQSASNKVFYATHKDGIQRFPFEKWQLLHDLNKDVCTHKHVDFYVIFCWHEWHVVRLLIVFFMWLHLFFFHSVNKRQVGSNINGKTGDIWSESTVFFFILFFFCLWLNFLGEVQWGRDSGQWKRCTTERQKRYEKKGHISNKPVSYRFLIFSVLCYAMRIFKNNIISYVLTTYHFRWLLGDCTFGWGGADFWNYAVRYRYLRNSNICLGQLYINPKSGRCKPFPQITRLYKNAF